MTASRAAIVLRAIIALGVGCAGCEKKESPSGQSGGATAAPDATAGNARDGGTGLSESTAPLPGCNAVTPGGTVLANLSPGALSLAVAGGKALLANSVYEGPPFSLDPTVVGKARADRVFLTATGAAQGGAEPVTDALPAGENVLTWAVAMPFGGALTTVSFAARRPTRTDCAEGVMTMTTTGAPRRELLPRACRWSSMMRGAARGKLGIVFVDGLAPERGPQMKHAVADVWVIDALELFPVRVHDGNANAPGTTRDAGLDPDMIGVDTPAVAAGATSVGAAWIVNRRGRKDQRRDLHVVRLGRRGERAGGVEVLDRENVGTVTLAFDGDTLHVVWSSFVTEKNRYVLRWSKWPAGGAPTPPQAVGTGVLSAFAPSLAIEEGRFMLAWAEGDEKSSTVKVGASRSGIAGIPGVANVVSTSGTIGRDPVVAMDGDAMFVAWKELGAEPRVRASAVTCSN